MAIISTLLKKGIRLRESLEQEYTSPLELQRRELKKLMIQAAHTEIAKQYNFVDILKASKRGDHSFYERYKAQVPIYDYNKIYDEWWCKLLEGQRDVTWPGKVMHFALSSGTSDSSSKYIPITKDMIKAIRRTGVRQILSLSKYDLPASLFTKGILMLGGSTDLEFNGTYFSGDLSGITAGRLPIWFQRFYKPGKDISRNKNWGDKLDQIVDKAKKWDIGIIVGVPAWLQILLEKIIAKYEVDNIHDIWPNLRIFVHGGVSFEPYKKGFEKLLGKPLIYMETYLASEGFLAFQALPNRKSMRLVLNNGIFYEFVPFTEENFDEEGNIKSEAKTLKIDEVEVGVDYALLISTCAGTWRYLIGDVIRFVSREESEIIITGRTKHYLSLCGEHLSVDNMNKAIELASEKLNVTIREFTVLGVPHANLFAHHWYVGTADDVNPKKLGREIDSSLKVLNDDYAVERKHALKAVKLTVLPVATFYEWMKEQGKEGGQNKFPRVLKGEKATSWQSYVSKQSEV
ncbi:GH3 auxin-responsive promoter family protein [Algoriphagus halophytocola]|uniref:GH3 auxin-responsive promoter family protein n=1 Tax=Algoriphagus halophytocola TaxID=2991499 RepID=A0ABY6MIL1_9BACT|nr:MULTISPECIES: GH3 auxin-responsive promoter family protein [unclassified Algoriphagus]UZD23314.1 GH3 auxin-responsive promoter family protein [Algoriphagus sp. TR-M5]WBL44609.1 GH3 auxin-responsive promoter family protein [Algoriphagus sp. TR-M9]